MLGAAVPTDLAGSLADHFGAFGEAAHSLRDIDRLRLPRHQNVSLRPARQRGTSIRTMLEVRNAEVGPLRRPECRNSRSGQATVFSVPDRRGGRADVMTDAAQGERRIDTRPAPLTGKLLAFGQVTTNLACASSVGDRPVWLLEPPGVPLQTGQI